MFEMILLAAATLTAPDPVVAPVADTNAPAHISDTTIEDLDLQRLEREHSLHPPQLAEQSHEKKDIAAAPRPPESKEPRSTPSAIGLHFARSIETYESM